MTPSDTVSENNSCNIICEGCSFTVLSLIFQTCSSHCHVVKMLLQQVTYLELVHTFDLVPFMCRTFVCSGR